MEAREGKSAGSAVDIMTGHTTLLPSIVSCSALSLPGP